MIRVFRREQEMDIDRRALRRLDPETHFDIRKNHTNVVQTAAAVLFENLFINGNAVIVGDTQRSY